MRARLIVLGLVVVAGYLALGDYVVASATSTPENFIAGIGRALAGAVSAIGQIFMS